MTKHELHNTRFTVTQARSFKRAQQVFTMGTEAGVSLVELMIVLTLSLVLIAGIIRFYVSNKSVQTMQTEVSQVQSDARFSMELISRDIRMSNSGGCRTLSYWSNMQGSSKVKNHVVNSPAFLNRFVPISGWEANNTGPGNSIGDPNDNNPNNDATFFSYQANGRDNNNWTAGGNPLNVATDLAILNSDILNVMYSGATNARVISVANNKISVADASVFKPGDYLLVSDCGSLDIVIACNVDTNNNTISLDDTASQDAACGNGAGDQRNDTEPFASMALAAGVQTISRLMTTTYFVGKPNLAANVAQNLSPSLYKTTNGSPAQQIVEGVESMQILYDGKPISSYTNAAMANNIKTIRISLLMSTESKLDVSRAQRSFDLNGYLVTPVKDNRVRRVYNTSIALRSQL